MKKVVVLGATGYVGSAITASLSQRGREVRGLGRADVDIRRPETIAPALEGADAIVHAAIDASPEAAEIDRRLVEWVLDRLEGSSTAFVYTSGAWVLGDTHGAVADESSATDPPAIVAWRPSVERLVVDAGGWVIRPGIVYGGGGGLIGMLFASARDEGAVRIVGDGRNHWPLVHREDLGDLYAKVIEERPDEHILHATDGTLFNVRRIADALSRAAGTRGRVLSTPLAHARASLGPLADALALDQRVSSARARHSVGWSPRHRSIIAEADDLWSSWELSSIGPTKRSA